MSWLNQGHVFDSIGNLLAGKRNVYVYGAGNAAREIMVVLDAIEPITHWNIYLVDKDPIKQAEGRYGRPVMSPEEFFEIKKEDFFVISGPAGDIGDEIFSILKSKFSNNEVIFKSFYFINTYLPIYFAYIHDMIFFASENMLVSTVCNLNCRDCLNFTPYIKEHCVESIEQIKSDVDLFFNAVDLIYRFQITGGEPLIYKNLPEVIDYIGSRYRKKIISFEMVTNGTIVPNEEICRALERNNVRVYLDDYREALHDGAEKYERCKTRFDEYNIEIINNYVDKWFRMYIPEIDEYRVESEKELIRKYKLCDNPWSNLWHGRISSCNYEFYAFKAGLCEWDDTGAYDLSTFNKDKKKELIEFRLRCCEKGFVEFCKKCNGWSEINERWCNAAIQMDKKK